MLLGFTATVAAACFCLSPTPLPEQIPVSPDSLDTPIHAALPADAIPELCLTSARAWSHLTEACPLMPVDPFIHVGARPFVLTRVR